MIPRIIHYCWFGRGPLPPLAERCMATWRTHLPGYEFRLWNEDNFDVHQHPYPHEAYTARKFAFVSDYARLKVLEQFGGIYLDTDVEIIRNLEEFLNYPAFIGFESDRDLSTALMGCTPGSEWVREQLAAYADRRFLDDRGNPDLTTNVDSISRTMAANGFLLENGYRVYRNCMHVFPKDYFCAMSRSGRPEVTENTCSIHHFAGSWQPGREKFKKFIFQRLIGPTVTEWLVRQKRNMKKAWRANP